MPSKPTASTHLREKLTQLGGGAVAVEPGDGTEPYVRWVADVNLDELCHAHGPLKREDQPLNSVLRDDSAFSADQPMRSLRDEGSR